MEEKERNLTDENFYTPFCLAAEKGPFEICQLIIECLDDNKDINKYLYSYHDRHSPFHKAAEHGHLNICTLILEKLQSMGLTGDEIFNPLHCCSGTTPLHLAGKQNQKY